MLSASDLCTVWTGYCVHWLPLAILEVQGRFQGWRAGSGRHPRTEECR